MHFIASRIQAQTSRRLDQSCGRTVVFNSAGHEQGESRGQQYIVSAHGFQSTFRLFVVFVAFVHLLQNTAAAGRREKLRQGRVARVADVDEPRINRKHALPLEHWVNGNNWLLTGCPLSQRELIWLFVQNPLELTEVARKIRNACVRFDKNSRCNEHSRVQRRRAGNAEAEREWTMTMTKKMQRLQRHRRRH